MKADSKLISYLQRHPKIYFAYGSNMNKKHLDDYLGHNNAMFIDTGILKIDNLLRYKTTKAQMKILCNNQHLLEYIT